jgi:hypothetical protein
MSKLVMGLKGDNCPRCNRVTEVWEHEKITAKMKQQAFYYSRWFRCSNPRCKTTIITVDRYKVFPGQPVRAASPRTEYSLFGGDEPSPKRQRSEEGPRPWKTQEQNAEQTGVPPWEE